jgi:hypothetical protein
MMKKYGDRVLVGLQNYGLPSRDATGLFAGVARVADFFRARFHKPE